MSARISAPSALFLLLALVAGSPAAAQSVPAEPSEEVTRERLVQFARTHLAVNEARDEFHGAVARVHDAEGRARAREEFDAKVAAIFDEHEMSSQEFDALTLRISMDGELRTRFEEILRELTETGG